MMQLHFKAVAEPTKPGPKWQQLFHTHWGAYRTWLDSKGISHLPGLKASEAALKEYMPEMLPTYERLCTLATADEVGARFLTGYQPPAYISGCAQAVSTVGKIQLVRNYDYHPLLLEGTLLLSAWNGRKVIANSDCLVGAVDGMNEDGLAISLAFGGRKVVGKGFGIPIILRYVLEFCTTVEEAIEALIRIPSHMSYNVTVLDRSSTFSTVQLAPDRAAVITNAAFTTNHQGIVEWPENAAFNKTLERSIFLEEMLSNKTLDPDKVAYAFQEAPLYNTRFAEGFGTLYTAVYYPTEGAVQLRWPNETMFQSFADFREETTLINFSQLSDALIPTSATEHAIHQKTSATATANKVGQVPLKPPSKKGLLKAQNAWERWVAYWKKWWI